MFRAVNDEQVWAAQVLLDRQRERMQQQMMRMLHSQMRQYWQLAQTCNDLILHASRQGVFLYMSHKCKRLLGYAPTELSSSRDTIGAGFTEMSRDELREGRALLLSAPPAPPGCERRPSRHLAKRSRETPMTPR